MADSCMRMQQLSDIVPTGIYGVDYQYLVAVTAGTVFLKLVLELMMTTQSFVKKRKEKKSII